MLQDAKIILDRLAEAPAILSSKKVAAGFDGFVDSIVKVVNYKAGDQTVYFDTIKEFGEYVTGKSGSGFSLENEEQVLKLGGNMPIMANAMATLGAEVDCVGAFGIPNIHSAFAGMHTGCRLHSYTNPGFTTAMEFNDGKLMLAQMTDLNHAGWDTIKQAVGIERFKTIFSEADLISLVNWSELDHSNTMWQGLLSDVFANEPVRAGRKFFFDLSDCSKRTPEAIGTAIELLKQFSRFGQVTLSLNRNEAGILYRTLFSTDQPDHVPAIAKQLFTSLGISALIIHNAKLSLVVDETGSYEHIPDFIATPMISTGAGDNFNAGYCIGQLLGLTPAQSLLLANSTSNCYITSGQSPTLEVLQAHFSKIICASL